MGSFQCHVSLQGCILGLQHIDPNLLPTSWDIQVVVWCGVALRIRLYVQNYPYIPILFGWDWKPKHPIRSGRGLDSYGWLIGWFLGVGELWFSGVCGLVN